MNAAGETRLLLRRMELTDLAGVLIVERAAHAHPWSEDLIRREMDQGWSTVLLAVEAAQGGERVAGHIIFWLVHDELHILNVATHPDYRRRGYGRALMEAAESQGLGRGAALSTLEVRRSNEAALGLYRGLGYKQVGVRPKYYADNAEDAIVMTKTFSQP